MIATSTFILVEKDGQVSTEEIAEHLQNFLNEWSPLQLEYLEIQRKRIFSTEKHNFRIQAEFTMNSSVGNMTVESPDLEYNTVAVRLTGFLEKQEPTQIEYHI